MLPEALDRFHPVREQLIVGQAFLIHRGLESVIKTMQAVGFHGELRQVQDLPVTHDDGHFILNSPLLPPFSER